MYFPEIDYLKIDSFNKNKLFRFKWWLRGV